MALATPFVVRDLLSQADLSGYATSDPGAGKVWLNSRGELQVGPETPIDTSVEWGDIEGTITDQTDLVAYVGNAVTGLASTSGTLAQFAATTSAQLAGVISDETGSGSLVFGTSPTFSGTVNMAALTQTGQYVNSLNGALSAPAMILTGTWITGGTATTCKPLVLIEPAGTTSTGWSTSGTGLGVNAVSGFAGNLFDFQIAGSSIFNGSASICNFFPNAVSSAERVFISKDGTFSYVRASQFQVNTGGGTFTWVGNSRNLGSGGLDLLSTDYVAWRDTAAFGTRDTFLFRDAANTLAQRNSTNAQTLRLSATHTDASNNVYGQFAMTTSGLTISMVGNGTPGSSNANQDITLTPRGTGRTIGSNGFAVPCLVSGSSSVLHIKSNTGSGGTEPEFYIGRSGSESSGIGIRGNGTVQCLGGIVLQTNADFLIGRSDGYAIQRGTSGQKIVFGAEASFNDQRYTFDAVSVNNTTFSFAQKTSTTNSVAFSQVERQWATNTHGSQKARERYIVYDTAARECLRLEADGSNPMIGFLGATASARSTGWTTSNVTTDKVIDANSTTLDEVADVLCTLIEEFKTKGLLGA